MFEKVAFIDHSKYLHKKIKNKSKTYFFHYIYTIIFLKKKNNTIILPTLRLISSHYEQVLCLGIHLRSRLDKSGCKNSIDRN